MLRWIKVRDLTRLGARLQKTVFEIAASACNPSRAVLQIPFSAAEEAVSRLSSRQQGATAGNSKTAARGDPTMHEMEIRRLPPGLRISHSMHMCVRGSSNWRKTGAQESGLSRYQV